MAEHDGLPAGTGLMVVFSEHDDLLIGLALIVVALTLAQAMRPDSADRPHAVPSLPAKESLTPTP